MVARGLFVFRELLDGAVQPPPPGVDTTPVHTAAGLSQRGVSQTRISNTACSGCHGKFEPLAFGLEKYDGLGAFHERDEHGNALRDDGEVLFPGTHQPVSYRSSGELMNLLAKSDRVQQTLTRRLVQFALGRPLLPADAAPVETIHREALEKDGGTYQSLMTGLVTSRLVRESRSR
jgi:hypothetical protein